MMLHGNDDESLRAALGAMARYFEADLELEAQLGTLVNSGEWGRLYRRQERDERATEWTVLTSTDVDGTPVLENWYGGGVDLDALT